MTADQRTRLAFALGFSVLLAGVIGVVVLAGGSDRGRESAGPCLGDWNTSNDAVVEGVHGYSAHGYRSVQVTGVNERGELVDVDAPGARCAVIFAAQKVDFEPDFGVRVKDEQGETWRGLFIDNEIAIDRIAELQREASALANATLLPSGQLANN